MGKMTDDELDGLLAATELPPPPEGLHQRVMARLGQAGGTPEAARAQWVARLAEVRRRFTTALLDFPATGLVPAYRGVDTEGGAVDSAAAVLAHVVMERSIRGQVFLTELESPADLLVTLRGGAGQVAEDAATDAAGRFCFLDLPADRYELAVPELNLTQSVQVGT